MAGSVNKVILVGNLGRDPEVRTMNNGGKVVTLNVATSESWKDRQSGERQERTEWHKVVIFNENLADVAERFLRKGAKVYLEGQLQTRKYTDRDGAERYVTEIVLQRYRGELTMLDGQRQGTPGEDERWPGRYGDSKAGAGHYDQGIGSGGRSGAAPDLDDEIPF